MAENKIKATELKPGQAFVLVGKRKVRYVSQVRTVRNPVKGREMILVIQPGCGQLELEKYDEVKLVKEGGTHG